METVLITGADGFIGSHLVEYLFKKRYKVRAFCLYNSIGSYGWLDQIDEKKKNAIDFYLGDIRDANSVREAMKGCSMVYHLASLISIPYSYVAPSSYIETNINGTLNVLQAAKELDLKKIIHTSTSETYGTAQFVPITEDHPLVGQSPYAASKIGADQLALSFWRSFGIPVSILRPFNTYGPRQSARAVIPTIITQIAKGKKDIKLGSLSPTRDFNFVEDTCAAFLEVGLSNKTLGKVINAASNFEISIYDTANLISEVMGKKINLISETKRIRPELSEVNRLFGDNTLLKELTSWRPKYAGLEGFKNGLELTAKWFQDKENLSKYNSDIYKI